jgi:arylsulfatase A-like enzyme
MIDVIETGANNKIKSMNINISKLLLLFSLISSYSLYAADQPNIVLIIADDLGFADLSINGSKQIKTPHIDALANSGAYFTEGYVSAPVCSPSRAGIITGRNQVEFGHDNNIGGTQPGFDPAFLGLPLTETTIATRLKSLGYKTGLMGKWHLGDTPAHHPSKRGFEEYWTYPHGGHDYFESLPDGKGYKSPLECSYKEPEPITYITDDTGNECVDFIKRNKAKPFFLMASFNAPHAPMQALEKDLEIYKDIENVKRRTYAAMVHRLDINVGKIVEQISTLGLSDNTLIVFISDNGGPTTSNASINAPYRGHKGTLLEGGIHVPYILNWKNSIPSGLKYKKPVTALDLASTFFAIAGGQITEAVKFDGRNLMPFLTDLNSEFPHSDIKWRFTISASIRDGDWKLIRLPDRLPLLYNLSNDISEQKNVALDNLDITNKMLKKLGDWDVSLPHPVFLEGAKWRANQLRLYDRKYQLTQPE